MRPRTWHAYRRVATPYAMAVRSGFGVVALLALACAVPEAETRSNLLLITIDTLRRDHCSAYGYARDTTPRLREVAAQGARFDAAYAPGPVTGPSHATLFTGLFPIGHGVVKNGLVLAASHETLAERLRARGYETGAVVSSFAVTSRFGYAQGFDGYREDFDPKRSSIVWKEWEGVRVAEGFDQPAPDATRRAIGWLDGRTAGGPFFLWVHYFDPHAPYIPPRRFRRFRPDGEPTPQVSRGVALYDAEVAYTDFWVGRLLDALTERGLAEETLIVITGDHGEGLFDHGYMEHDFQLYEEAVQVPLLLRWPGRIDAGRVVSAPVSLADLLPTLLELLELAPDDSVQGVSLVPLLAHASGDAERPIHLQRHAFPPTRLAGRSVLGEAFAVRAGRWKYIEAPDEKLRELYDLEADPDEQENVYDANRSLGESFSERIAAWRRANVREASEGTVSEEDRERLRAMGYAQ